MEPILIVLIVVLSFWCAMLLCILYDIKVELRNIKTALKGNTSITPPLPYTLPE